MDPATTALFVGSLLSGTVEAIVSSVVQPALAALVGKIKASRGRAPANALDEALAEGVRRCLPLVSQQLGLGGPGLQSRASALLQSRAFLEEAVRVVLFDERPNLKALAEVYRRGEEAEGRQAAEVELEAIRELLLRSFELLKQHLTTHAEVGEVVRDSRDAALKADLSSAEMLAVQREIAAHTARTAVAAEKGNDLLTDIRDRLPVLPADTDLTPEELAYLGLLDLHCNRLPLVEEEPMNTERGGGQVLLRNVYVDLATTAGRNAKQLLDRLQVPEKERAALLAELAPEVEGRPGRARNRPGPGELLGLPVGPESLPRFGPKSSWRQWVNDEADWRRAVEVTALDALKDEKHLVLLGGPGSGKSTWVNFLALTFAGGLKGTAPRWREALGTSFAAPLFPFRVQLRRCHEHLAAGGGLQSLYQAIAALSKIPRPRLLWRFQRADTVVFFDGLDEVPTAASGDDEAAGDRRAGMVAAVEEFCAAHGACRVVVTCRVKPYESGGYTLRGKPVFKLAELDRGRVEQFVTRWYEELEAGGRLDAAEAAQRRGRLLEVSARRDDVGRMTRSPLLLTMLAQVNARAPLPEGRPELYEKCVEQLLWKWEKRVSEGGGVKSLDDLVGKDLKPDFERALWRLAFRARAGELTKTDAILTEELRRELAGIRPADQGKEWQWAQQVVELMSERGGVLVENDPGIFSFPHPSFGEFLAARWLLESGEGPVLARRLGEDDRWQEVIPLATGFLTSHGSFLPVETLLAEMVAGEKPASAREWRRVLLAAHAFHAFGTHRVSASELGRELKGRLPLLLRHGFRDESLGEALRCEAGLLLGDLGERPADLGCFVPVVGRTEEDSFRVGKYPVTNAEFDEFLAAGGYDPERDWWSDEAKQEILDFQKRYVDGRWPEGPRLAGDERFNRPTQPVAGISWYEAVAYCAWLTGERRAEDDPGRRIEVGDVACLPTVEQWQRACGGEEKRPFPWGEQPLAARANTKESGLGHPSPVGMYLNGASPEGVLDLAGNVWEWTADPDEQYKDARVLVGGSWWDRLEKTGTAARGRVVPWSGLSYFGFRVVLVPSSRRSSGF